MEGICVFDLVSLALVLFLGIKGILRGFIKEVFGLVGLIGGIFVASRFAQKAGDFIDTNFLHLENKASIYLIGFLVTLILFWLIAVFIGSMLSKLTIVSGLGFFDRLLGFVVGAAKVFFIFSIIIYVLSSIDIIKKSMDNKFKNSFMYPKFNDIGAYIVKLDPNKLSSKTIENITEIGNK